MILQPTAENIAFALDSPRQVAPHKFIACCPAHHDKHPSFAITETAGKVLIHCFAGCTQYEVIEALRRRGLWPQEKRPAEVHTLIGREEMLTFCLAHESDLKRNIPTSTAHKRLYGQYQRILCKPFTPGEIAEMNMYCHVYASQVRAGKPTTPKEDDTFMLYQEIVYKVGVIPYVW